MLSAGLNYTESLNPKEKKNENKYRSLNPFFQKIPGERKFPFEIFFNPFYSIHSQYQKHILFNIYFSNNNKYWKNVIASISDVNHTLSFFTELTNQTKVTIGARGVL